MDANFARLQHLSKFGSGIGFQRMDWLLADVRGDAWFSDLKSIRLTGSNGKGSVAAMLASIFKALQIDCGLYTSPHLLRFNERFRLNGDDIPDAELARSIDWFLAREQAYAESHPQDQIGSFEAFTAIALHYFSLHRPATVVAEVGIGGRYDPVRTIPGNLVGLTSLDLEHTNLLGSTLEQIAYDKADLCPDGGTLVVGNIDAEILRRVRAYCRIRNIQLVSAEEAARVDNVSYSGAGMRLDVEMEETSLRDLQVGLQGPHQISNTLVTILLATTWLKRNMPELPAERIEQGIRGGLEQVKWPGRFQHVHKRPDVYVDVGHTPAAIHNLLATVREVLPGKRILLITGASGDKNVEEIVARLVSLADEVICTRAYHRGAAVSRIASIARLERPDVPVHEAETIELAVESGLGIAEAKDMTILVAGGLFLAVEAMVALQGRNPQELHFF